MNKIIEYVIGAKDKTGSAIKSALSSIKSFASSVGSQLANIKAGFDMAAGVVRQFSGVFVSAIKEAFKFEKATTDFKVLLGSIDKAKTHIAELRQFASSTPLTFGDLSGASKLLLSFGTSVEEVMPAMKMLGDISMGDAQKFKGLALVFAQVKSAGRLMGQDLLQMINQGFNPLTIIAQQTGKSVGELKDMVEKGAISFEMVAEAMRVATSEGGLFNNAMAEASKTGEGLVSTLSDKWTDCVRTFGEAFTDAAKGGLQLLIEKLTELVEDGTIDEWANKVARGLNNVVSFATQAASAIGKVVDVYNAIRDWGERAGAAVGGWIGTKLNGGSFSDASKAASAAAASVRREQQDRDRENAESDARAREAGAERRAASKSKKQADADKKQTETLAQMMAKIDEQAAKKKAEEAAKAAKKAAEAEEKERKRIEKEIAAEKEREWKKYVATVRKDVSDWQKEEQIANARLQDAQEKEKKAWGWYRDRDSWKAQLQEERDNAAAEKQFEKDFEKLKSRKSDWRTAKLNDDDELIRRVALAREEKKAAEDYARLTAEASERAASALEEIQSSLEGE